MASDRVVENGRNRRVLVLQEAPSSLTFSGDSDETDNTSSEDVFRSFQSTRSPWTPKPGSNNNRFNIHQHFTCTSANVVYVLVCKRCYILYVGETKRRLADRVTEHLKSIKQNLPGFPVATHFNPHQHGRSVT
ncbi:hypothetical protein HOLleu_04853 [Holothuria leucospilota]|uniref:GIY-YIG domain-containing protein n=1 Tax=Holothuria leucospilota TaxID=206669 RepID=A0A9Q1CK52_HOLLE|nr:hypothetical protein HOLleu_04853 [Holothuria leucospilota]